MDRTDRLILKVTSRERLFYRLKKDNPYIGLSYEELRQMMRQEAVPGVPENKTEEKDKYSYALILAYLSRERAAPLQTADPDPEPVKDPEAGQDPEEDSADPDPLDVFYKLYPGDRDKLPTYLR